MVKKYLKQNQVFWNLAGKFSWLWPDYFFKKLPEEIFIEATNACNLRCLVCPTHFAMKRERGYMSLDLFKSIIDEFKDKKQKPKISMIFAGEPLLHKDIDKFIEYASRSGHETFISTNATLLAEELSEKLILAGLTAVHLCIDGAKKQSHEAYRVGSNFESVKSNIERFFEIKKKLKKENPKTTIQTLLTSYSEDEMDELESWAKAIGADAINFKSFNLGSYTSAEMKKQYSYLLPKNLKFRRKTSKINKTACAFPLRYGVVFWNGDLGLCCVDFDAEVKMANIREQGFLKTFFSEANLKKRRFGFQKKYPLCRKCSIGNADYMGETIKFKI